MYEKWLVFENLKQKITPNFPEKNAVNIYCMDEKWSSGKYLNCPYMKLNVNAEEKGNNE